MKLIKLKEVSKRYGQAAVLENVNLTIEEEEILGYGEIIGNIDHQKKVVLKNTFDKGDAGRCRVHLKNNRRRKKPQQEPASC